MVIVVVIMAVLVIMAVMVILRVMVMNIVMVVLYFPEKERHQIGIASGSTVVQNRRCDVV